MIARADALKLRERAGFALIGVGGAAAVVDLALFIVAARRNAREQRVQR